MATGCALVGRERGLDDAVNGTQRNGLGLYQPHIADLERADFKVRILNGGTGATTRVLIESEDGEGRCWFTIGVSETMNDASFRAPMDSIVYKLVTGGDQGG